VSGTRIASSGRFLLATCQIDGCPWRASEDAATPEAVLGHVASTGHSVHVCDMTCTEYAPARTAAVARGEHARTDPPPPREDTAMPTIPTDVEHPPRTDVDAYIQGGGQ
jgi:hypothetical protein